MKPGMGLLAKGAEMQGWQHGSIGVRVPYVMRFACIIAAPSAAWSYNGNLTASDYHHHKRPRALRLTRTLRPAYL